MKYEVDADIYEGPLTLLVELTRRHLLDVFLIKLVDLTQQYLHEIKDSSRDVNALSEPLPLLGMLLATKARGLLPQPQCPVEDEELPVSLEELERRLQEYQQFKTVAQLLAELHALAHQRFTRAPHPWVDDPDSADLRAQGETLEIGLADLMGAFSKILERSTAGVYEVVAERYTVEEKIQELRVLLAVRRQVRFLELFGSEQSRLQLVVTFLALLELIRQRIARALQESSFGEILVVYHEKSASTDF